MAEKRIYVVTETVSDGVTKETLVKAQSQAGAISLLVKARFAAVAAHPNDIVRLMGAGAKVLEDTDE